MATPQQMDEAASKALAELQEIEAVGLKDFADWFKRWYTSAGHKRLGRGLVALAKELEA